MTIVPVQTLEPDDLPHLGDNLTEAIRLDYEDLESGSKDPDCLKNPQEEGADEPDTA